MSVKAHDIGRPCPCKDCQFDGVVQAADALAKAAQGLSHGTDWNNGTHAKTHGYRQQLLEALAAYELLRNGGKV